MPRRQGSGRRHRRCRALLIAIIVAMNLVIAMPSGRIEVAAASIDQSEGCHAYNPGHPTCTFRMTQHSGTAVTGWSGVGKWTVTLYRNGKVLKFKSPPTGELYSHTMKFRPGDHVHAAALSAGSFIQIGHVSP